MSVAQRLLMLAVMTGAVIVACDGGPPSFGVISPGNLPPDGVDVNPPSDLPPGFGGQMSSPCPGFEPPRVGEDCSASWNNNFSGWDGTCEYGHDIERSCNDIYSCSTAWSLQTKGECEAARCPKSFDAITVGAACPDDTVGCSYVEGTCACVAVENTGNNDGGTQKPTSIWKCAPPPGNGCPAQRPSVESDCVREMTCDYGSCALRRDLTFGCEGQSWFQKSSDCP